MYIRTRRELAGFISERMNKTYVDLSEDQRLELGSSLAKVYLMEVHLDSGASHKEICGFLNNSASIFQKEHRVKATIVETDEEKFFNAKFEVSGEAATFYIDASDGRFWFLHSMDKSETIDPLVEKMAIGNQDIDRAWMPIQLLEAIKNLGELRGLNLDYDRRKIRDIDFEAPNAPPEFLIMQMWGNKAEKVLQILSDDKAFPTSTTLSKVKIRYRADSDSKSDYTLDDIKYDGKITARGTSFASHNTLITTLMRKYSNKIRDIEQRFAMSYNVDDGQFSIQGSPIFVVFKNPIPNLVFFCRSLFSCSYPFKLWGVPMIINDQHIRVSGIDLHIGKKLDFEITPEFMRIYLPENTCANSVIRIITNLQHYYDSRLDAQDSDGKSLLEY